MASAANAVQASGSEYLRGQGFDMLFIFGIPAVAIGMGALVTLRPELFVLIFTVDLWLLGYHHVAATFTRLCFDSESFKTHRSLVLYLPVAVAVVVVALVASFGIWLIATIYLYWQWWHYTRQSDGLCKAYAGKNTGRSIGRRCLARATFYSVPIAGILSVSARQPSEFLFLPIWTVPIPMGIATGAQVLALILVVGWAVEQLGIWRRRQHARTYVAYMVTHVLIYATAYIFIENASQGWMVINIWHNAQYIAFVWMFNNRRFARGVEPKHPLLSTLSQGKNWWMYLAACLAASTAFYYSTEVVLTVLGVTTVGYLAAFYQVVNFHHYIVDSKIWKLRQPAIRRHVGLSESAT